MNELEISINQEFANFKTQYASIQAIRENLSHPIEIEAFGSQFFLSLIGQRSQVSISLKDQSNNEIDHDKYEIQL